MDKQNKFTMDKKAEDRINMKQQDKLVEKQHLKYFPFTGNEAFQERANENKKKLGIKEQYDHVRQIAE